MVLRLVFSLFPAFMATAVATRASPGVPQRESGLARGSMSTNVAHGREMGVFPYRAEPPGENPGFVGEKSLSVPETITIQLVKKVWWSGSLGAHRGVILSRIGGE